jgi:hypothetical protein
VQLVLKAQLELPAQPAQLALLAQQVAMAIRVGSVVLVALAELVR